MQAPEHRGDLEEICQHHLSREVLKSVYILELLMNVTVPGQKKPCLPLKGDNIGNSYSET